MKSSPMHFANQYLLTATEADMAMLGWGHQSLYDYIFINDGPETSSMHHANHTVGTVSALDETLSNASNQRSDSSLR